MTFMPEIRINGVLLNERQAMILALALCTVGEELLRPGKFSRRTVRTFGPVVAGIMDLFGDYRGWFDVLAFRLKGSEMASPTEEFPLRKRLP